MQWKKFQHSCLMVSLHCLTHKYFQHLRPSLCHLETAVTIILWLFHTPLHSQNRQSGDSAGKHGRLTTLWAPSRVLSAFPHTCPGYKVNTRGQQTAVLGGVFDQQQDCCSLYLSQITPTVKSWQSIQLLLGHKHGSTQIFIRSKTNACRVNHLCIVRGTQGAPGWHVTKV